jgi:hypothetical protein
LAGASGDRVGVVRALPFSRATADPTSRTLEDTMRPRKLSFTIAAAAALAAAALSASTLAAQSRAQGRGPQGVPPGHLPPAGTCRIWYDGVPPGRQPAPMRCAEAERRAPRNARVIYGAGTSRDDRVWDGRRDDRRDDRYDDRRDGRYDDRRDDRYDPRYDPRYDSRDDPRYDPRDGRRRTDDSDARRRTGRGVYNRSDVYGRPGGYGSLSLPQMLAVRMLEQRRWTTEVERWVGVRPAHARFSDANRDGWPEQIWFLDARGRVLQHWRDESRDGRADRVGMYRDGRLERTIG